MDIKRGPVTKLDKRNKTTSIKFDNDAMSANCDVIVICPVYGQFGAIRKPDSGNPALKLTFALLATYYLLQKLKTELKNLQHSSHTIALKKGTIFAKNAEFLQKYDDISNIKRSGLGTELHMYVN